MHEQNWNKYLRNTDENASEWKTNWILLGKRNKILITWLQFENMQVKTMSKFISIAFSSFVSNTFSHFFWKKKRKWNETDCKIESK